MQVMIQRKNVTLTYILPQISDYPATTAVMSLLRAIEASPG